jgi:hypothetical protein
MTTKSKFFRVAVEGASTDGRTIDRNWIKQMARNFDPVKYGARIWLEHLRGTLPDSPFRAYGDVLALKAEDIEIGGAKKLALFAQINPTPELVALTKARQKIYTSIEVSEKFADTGEAYLVGLGITDSPASLGTEVLSFAAQNPEASPFKARKVSPDNLFSAAEEVTIEFEEIPDPADNKFSKAMNDLLAKLGFKQKTDDARFDTVEQVFKELVENIAEQRKEFATADALAALTTQHTALQSAFNALKAQLDSEPGKQPTRPTATGKSAQETDC